MENLVSYDIILSSISNNLFSLAVPLAMIGLGDACADVNGEDCNTFTCAGTDVFACSAGSE
jgi:hypothetical protein